MTSTSDSGSFETGAFTILTLAELLERYRIEGPVDLTADRERWEADAAAEVISRACDSEPQG